jgi:hypothetical protein
LVNVTLVKTLALETTPRRDVASARAPDVLMRTAPRAARHPRLPGPHAPSRVRASRGPRPESPWGSCPRRVAPSDVHAESLTLVCAAKAQAAYNSHWLLIARTCLLHLALYRNWPPVERMPFHSPSRSIGPLEAAAVSPMVRPAT